MHRRLGKPKNKFHGGISTRTLAGTCCLHRQVDETPSSFAFGGFERTSVVHLPPLECLYMLMCPRVSQLVSTEDGHSFSYPAQCKKNCNPGATGLLAYTCNFCSHRQSIIPHLHLSIGGFKRRKVIGDNGSIFKQQLELLDWSAHSVLRNDLWWL